MKFAFKIFALLPVLALFAMPVIAQDAAAPTPATAAPAKTIVIHAKKFEFVPAEITLTKGQTVKLELTSDDVLHSLLVPDLNINGILRKGQMTDVVVTPQQTGDFEGRCGKWCGEGHLQMHFVVHVVN